MEEAIGLSIAEVVRFGGSEIEIVMLCTSASDVSALTIVLAVEGLSIPTSALVTSACATTVCTAEVSVSMTELEASGSMIEEANV